jgi:hypothetical protein
MRAIAESCVLKLMSTLSRFNIHVGRGIRLGTRYRRIAAEASDTAVYETAWTERERQRAERRRGPCSSRSSGHGDAEGHFPILAAGA